VLTRYSVGGRGAAVSASGDPHAVLWNASTTKQIYVLELSIENPGTIVATIAIQRTSTKGTPGSTVTPDIDNDRDRAVAPVSSVVLDLADFTVLPTFQGPRWSRTNLATNGGALGIVFSVPVAVPQNTGLMVEAVSGLATIETTWTWEE
jgi:hypothetical protein